MAELKTKKRGASVAEFLDGLDDDQREDAVRLARLMERVTGAKPKMWGNSIVGFGDVHLRYESGRELDWFLTGFSPRAKLTVYLSGGLEPVAHLLPQLGKHTTGKGCIYVARLADIDEDVLSDVLEASVETARAPKKAPAKKKAAKKNR